MYFKLHHRALLRGITAGAVLLAGASACSRSDKTSGGANTDETQTGAAAATDTQPMATRSTTAAQPSSADTGAASKSSTAKPNASAKAKQPSEPPPNETGVSGYKAMDRNSSGDTSSASRDTVVVGDSAHIGKTGKRLEPTQSSQQGNADTVASQPESDRIRPPEDSSETVGVTTGDTTAATDSSVVSTEMARDTTTALGQADTTPPADTSAQVTADTSAVQAQVDTTEQTEMAQQAPVDTTAIQAQVDTTRAQTDSSSAAHPTEMAQKAPADTAAVERVDTAAVEQPSEVAPQAQQSKEQVQSDQAAVGAAGVTTGNMATGAEAVALMSREGRRCSVVDAEEERDARWDLASSPATLNPCGTGTMTLPRVQEER